MINFWLYKRSKVSQVSKPPDKVLNLKVKYVVLNVSNNFIKNEC